ncbi:MAG: sensor histidine kinase [Terriglobales bacterium]
MQARLVARSLVRGAAAISVVAGIAALFHLVAHVNATTVALAFLLAVLAVSTLWGMAVAVVASLAAVLAFNYFFLPPVGTLTIADPQNWIALIAFLIVAVVGSNLSARAKREAREATRGRRETERLYAFSQLLLEAGDVLALVSALPGHLAATFGAAGAAIYIAQTQTIHRCGTPAPELDGQFLRAVMLGAPPLNPAAGVCAPVRLGLRPVGSFGLTGASLTRPTLEALGSLIAIALERARAVEQLGVTEAARESERLKSVLLDSVTHDFRTPLTAIKAAITALLSGVAEEPARRELLQIIDQESDRLNGLIEEAAEMARLEAGGFAMPVAPCAVEDLVAAAVADCRNSLGPRRLSVAIPPGLGAVRADLASAKKVLVRLLENADQYSPRSEPIAIAAARKGDFVSISVADHGPGIDARERALIFDKFYRGREQRNRSRGTGMGLPIARAIAEAHGGDVTIASPAGRGSVFVFSLPVAERADGQP